MEPIYVYRLSEETSPVCPTHYLNLPMQWFGACATRRQSNPVCRVGGRDRVSGRGRGPHRSDPGLVSCLGQTQSSRLCAAHAQNGIETRPPCRQGEEVRGATWSWWAGCLVFSSRMSSWDTLAIFPGHIEANSCLRAPFLAVPRLRDGQGRKGGGERVRVAQCGPRWLANAVFL